MPAHKVCYALLHVTVLTKLNTQKNDPGAKEFRAIPSNHRCMLLCSEEGIFETAVEVHGGSCNHHDFSNGGGMMLN